MQTTTVRLLERHRRTRALAAAAAIWVVGCALFGLTLWLPRRVAIPAVFLIVAVYTVGKLLALPTTTALVAAQGPPHLRGRYLAAFELSWGVADALTPLAFTALYVRGAALPWLFGAGLALIAGVGVRWLEPRLSAQAVRAAP